MNWIYICFFYVVFTGSSLFSAHETMRRYVEDGHFEKAQKYLVLNSIKPEECYKMVKIVCRSGDSPSHASMIEELYKHVGVQSMKLLHDSKIQSVPAIKREDSIEAAQLYLGAQQMVRLRKEVCCLSDLEHAFDAGHIKIAQLLLKWGARPYLKEFGSNMLYSSALLGRVESVELLLKEGVQIKGEHGYTGNSVWHAAVTATKNAKKIIEILQKKYFERHHKKFDLNAIKNTNAQLPLHIIAGFRCKYIRADVVKHLLKEGAQADARDKAKRVPAHYAALNDCDRTINQLKKHGADLDAIDCDGNTPLHFACSVGAQDAIDKLLECKVAIEKKNNAGDTPLHLLVKIETENKDRQTKLVKAIFSILKCKASVHNLNNKKETAASYCNDMVKKYQDRRGKESLYKYYDSLSCLLTLYGISNGSNRQFLNLLDIAVKDARKSIKSQRKSLRKSKN